MFLAHRIACGSSFAEYTLFGCLKHACRAWQKKLRTIGGAESYNCESYAKLALQSASGCEHQPKLCSKKLLTAFQSSLALEKTAIFFIPAQLQMGIKP